MCLVLAAAKDNALRLLLVAILVTHIMLSDSCWLLTMPCCLLLSNDARCCRCCRQPPAPQWGRCAAMPPRQAHSAASLQQHRWRRQCWRMNAVGGRRENQQPCSVFPTCTAALEEEIAIFVIWKRCDCKVLALGCTARQHCD